MAAASHILFGPWTEYASNTSYILVSERVSSYITIFVALGLWLSLLRSYEVPRRLALRVCDIIAGPNQTPDADIVMQDLPIRVTVAAITAQVLSTERAPEKVISRILSDYVFVSPVQLPASGATQYPGYRRRFRGAVAILKKNPAKLSAVVATGVFYFGLALSYQLIAAFTGRIIGHEIGHSNSPHAGAWFPDIFDPVHMVNTSIFPAVNDFQTDLIFKALAYADNCYKASVDSSECSVFYSSKIDYVERHNASCPFERSLCWGKPDTAYELDTEWKSANILGINEKHTCQFRMRKVCSPLNLDGHIRTKVVEDSGTRYVEYMLGDGWGIVQEGNKTFGELVRDPFQQRHEPAQYLIREVKEDAIKDASSPRQLIPGLQVRGSKTTLFFVRPINLEYTRPSSDPVFPATLSPGLGMANGDPLYINALQRSTAFACADTFTIRHPKHHLEWLPRYQNLTALEDARWINPNVLPSLHMVNMTHLAPSYFSSRYSDMSTHFNAPRRIGSFYSSPVDQEQWKFESRKVYNTDLALLQYHTLGIAQGLGHDLPRAHNLLSDYGIDARGKVLFPAPGTKNIRVSALLGFVCASMACWIFTYEIREGPTETTLLITVVLYSIWTLMVKRMPANLGNIWAKLGKPGSFDELAHMLDATVRRVKQCLGQS